MGFAVVAEQLLDSGAPPMRVMRSASETPG